MERCSHSKTNSTSKESSLRLLTTNCRVCLHKITKKKPKLNSKIMRTPTLQDHAHFTTDPPPPQKPTAKGINGIPATALLTTDHEKSKVQEFQFWIIPCISISEYPL
ncbi:hypothetical protein KP509_19G047600 [Ceratopteris richardii]|uniref:Uncharacterized protein n=1 Tax=Ceratopteris richardii TaxID=49495 RepID=A0A8T2SJY6_CERRI|nr:hypothetical protein KP509_19G047600 [Ceratopteris richardii]